MSDLFLTLAQVDGELTCFMVPRWDDNDCPNRMHIQRLKDKVGNRSNASSEIEYDNAFAQRLGAVGRGVPTIIEMVTHTRLDCVVASASNMRFATAHAIHHAMHRKAFGRHLLDQPVMRGVLADLSLESMAAMALAFQIADAYEIGTHDSEVARRARLWTAVGKYWICKRAPLVVTEAMECHGGNGFVAPHPMSRLYKEAPLNSIWEGSGNVICLDVLRTLSKRPELIHDCFQQLGEDCNGIAGADNTLSRLKQRLSSSSPELEARSIVEEMAILLQAAALRRYADEEIAQSFGKARMVDKGFQIGALSQGHPTDALINGLISR